MRECAHAAETWHSISLIEPTGGMSRKRARADVSQPSRRLSTPRRSRESRDVRSFVVAVIDYQRRIINRLLPGFPAGRGNARGGQRDTRTTDATSRCAETPPRSHGPCGYCAGVIPCAGVKVAGQTGALRVINRERL